MELEIDPEIFWDMSWYDWGIHVLRLMKHQKRRLEDHELYLAVERVKIADFRNANRGKHDMAIKPQDIFLLSFDKAIMTDERPLTFKEAKALFGSKIKKGGE